MTISRRSVIQLAVSVCIIAFGFVSDGFGQRIFKAVLDGVQEVPVVATTATGKGTVVLNAAETHISYRLEFSGLLSNQTAAHIHGAAARGGSAGVLFGIGSNGATSDIFFAENVAITAGQVADLKNGLFYFNVHSTINGGGEIRGQIEPDCATLPSGLVSWWRGEGNAIDQNALNSGILENGVTFAGGKSGRAFSFDGTDDFVDVLDSSSLDVSTAMTINAWFFPTEFKYQRVITKWGTGGFRSFSIDLGVDGSASFYISSDGDNFPSVTTPPGDVPINQWTHIAVTFQGGNALKIFINGVERASGVSAASSIFNSPSSFRLGRNFNDAPGSFSYHGLLDEIDVFNRTLSQSEIASIYNAGAAGKCPSCTPAPVGLAEWWTADGNTLGVRNRNNGTLMNGATFAEGKGGHAFSLDGTNDFVSVLASSTLNVGTANGFTIEAWVKPESTNGANGMPIIEYDSVSQVGVHLWTSVGGVANSLYAGLNSAIQTSANTVPLNQFSHVAVTYDKTTGNAQLFVNGALSQSANVGIGTPLTAFDVNIGGRTLFGQEKFDGLIDELSLYDRVLAANEIAAIANAGSACKCKPTATTAPSGQVAWYGGDGNANDIAGTNNGTLQNGAGFAVSKVGQGFNFDGTDDFVSVPDAPSLDLSLMTIESWVFPTADAGVGDTAAIIINKETVSPFMLQYEIGRRNSNACSGIGIATGNLVFLINVSGVPNECSGWIDGNAALPLNAWTHIALTYDGSNIRSFVNGALTRTIAASGTVPNTNGELRIGGRSDGVNIGKWGGRIDETSLYNRALSDIEIQSIFNAGLAGKLKNVVTPINFAAGSEKGGNATVKERAKGPQFAESPQGTNIMVGDATIQFNVTTAGVTQWVPLSFAGLPLPALQSAGLTYDISTTAVYNGTPQVCFNLPSFTMAQFPNLRILHFENGSWIDRTGPAAYPSLCTIGLPSLSPFAIVFNIPTAASVSVSGRVLTANGQGVSRARVTITDSDGISRTALTGSFGYYRFDAVVTGRTYVVSIGSKRYAFTPRVVNVNDELSDLDFVAIE